MLAAWHEEHQRALLCTEVVQALIDGVHTGDGRVLTLHQRACVTPETARDLAEQQKARIL